MAKIRNPSTLSRHFDIAPDRLVNLGVLDPTLSVDTKLFIDPLLFEHSRHREMHEDAVEEYRHHFETVIKFLAATNGAGDVAWRSARRLLEFHEIKGTCLGYGANSIYGSGFGEHLTNQILQVGKEIVDLGIDDPDLFSAMALFEAHIGPDRISDMATNVVGRALIKFNRRILSELQVAGQSFQIVGDEGHFLRNPFQPHPTPIVLVPRDVLRDLPIAMDWDGVADAASTNQTLRNQVNQHLGHIWAAKTKTDKDQLRAQALASRDAFQSLLDVLHMVPTTAYDVSGDPDGLLRWANVAKAFADQFPLALVPQAPYGTLAFIHDVVSQIIEHFRQLIVHNGLNRELYKENGEPRHESTAQRLFFAIAHCYCEANDIDVSPEVDSGSGQIDFKFSTGFHSRVLVEVKLSTNSKLVAGYEKQLEAYKLAEQTMRAFYLVLDVGRMGRKRERLYEVRNEAWRRGEPLSDLEFVDGTIRPSASRR